MNRLRLMIDRALAGILCVLMAVLVLDVLWQVFSRFVLRSASSYTEELARYLMIWVGLLGASYAAGKRLHLAVDVLSSRWTGRAKRLNELFIHAAIFCFALAVLVGGGTRLALITLKLEQTSAALQVPLGYVYLVLPISGLLMMGYSLFDFIGAWRSAEEAAEPGSVSKGGTK